MIRVVIHHLETDHTWYGKLGEDKHFDQVSELIEQVCEAGEYFRLETEVDVYVFIPKEMIQKCVFRVITGIPDHD